MDLEQRIKRTNTPTFGTVSDEKIDKSAMNWIMSDVSNIPENAYFFLKFVSNSQTGITVGVEIRIEIDGVIKGPYDPTQPTTCAEALASFNI